ncbi:BCLAF1 and THRAP3 family member 3 isoform X2 [Lacerta agilis]|uniref:BCLAF1 and THRAP3 family member 3 isoform X2 n=1 Tax=Lacerta agilis TaxID=80427 RepID=UPI00141A2CCD|nr:BCLAF1 and THRAP3 family member 3 isoform X2 [Lacerta agilis]
MVRSRSRSPRWKRRSLSPAFRSQEHNRQRHNHSNYDCEYKAFRKDAKKPMPWRVEDEKYGQASTRYAPHESNHHRLYECRSYSPTLKRIPSEDMYSHKPGRTHSPERNADTGRCHFPSRYPEMSRKEHNHSFYPSKTRDREMHEDPRAAAGNTKGMKTFHEPLGTSCNFERKWNENDLRHHQLKEDKYTQSPRRCSDEFMSRSSLQKRYPGDRDYREHGHTSKRAKELERYDDREVASNSKWKQDHSSLNQEKGEQRNPGLQTHRPVVKEYSDSCQTKITYDYSQKRHRHPDGGKYISDERAEKYTKVEEKKYNSPKEAWNSKYSNYYNSERVRHTEDPHTEASVKYISGKGCNSCAKSHKSDADLLPFDQKEKERLRKEMDFRGRRDQHDTHHKISDVKMSDVHHTRKEKLTVKVDMKKTINKYRSASSHVMERQTSCDLVAVGRKTEKFHPVFEHIKSVTQKVEQNPSKEFAQEIITIIHQVKDYFKSPDLTLHERFSKVEDKPLANEVKRHSNPEIHRRIDMSLAELQKKRAVPCKSEQSVLRVLEDPNDLRYDIERRRKERLRNEDENNFYIDGASHRDEQRSSIPKLRNTQMYGFQKPARFVRSPFRKFIRKPHMNHHYTSKSHGDIAHDRFEDNTEHHKTFRRPFKPHFSDGRPHFKSNLVQKGLDIQAKYQRLRYAGTRGLTTNKFRGGYLRKDKGLEI